MARPVLRTCVGCRRIREQRTLVRITADPSGGVRVDAPKAPGRGAYLCASLPCLEKAWHRRVFPRAFRRALPGLDEAALRERFGAALQRRGVIAA
ncbi:MAG: YlxR family protein [candidate division NC10 bacterium]|nr:YlxR family protein [candidate division NC10 bacterium]MBI2457645.1 YlxR family protein [candidate division NC10 bacterium]MBI2561213.1 YlxR family protein [candidate division NC10 bacterium]